MFFSSRLEFLLHSHTFLSTSLKVASDGKNFHAGKDEEEEGARMKTKKDCDEEEKGFKCHF